MGTVRLNQLCNTSAAKVAQWKMYPRKSVAQPLNAFTEPSIDVEDLVAHKTNLVRPRKP